MKISWAVPANFVIPLDITITCKDSYEHYLYKNIGVYDRCTCGQHRLVRVMGLKCRRVCRACFEKDTRLHVNPAILRDIQTGVRTMRPPISTSVTIHELKSFASTSKEISRASTAECPLLDVAMNETVEKLSHVEHVLKRPDSYVGSTSLVAEEYWLLNADASRFEKRIVRYSPALLKIFDEVLVNAIDRNSLFPKEVTSIKIDVDTSTERSLSKTTGRWVVSGRRERQRECLQPRARFDILTSTNYDDSQKRIVGGRNGYGAKLANIYSQDFAIRVKDPVNKVLYTQKWMKNMSVRGEPKVKAYASATASVSVTFTPDWKRFHMDGIDAEIVDVFRKRAGRRRVYVAAV